MYSEELNKLIEAALVDGVLTDKERDVIKKRAISDGIDPDEVDMILDAELQKLSKNSKLGSMKRCPNCNAEYEAGNVKCPVCGYVFVGVDANSSTKRLAEQLEQLDKTYRNVRETGLYSRFLGEGTREEKLDSERAKIVKSFPVPTAKDDLLEFIITMETRWHNTTSQQTLTDQEKMAYRSKYKECLQKARLFFADDKDFLPLFEQAEKNKYSLDNLSKRKKMLIIAFLLLSSLYIIPFLVYSCSN